jgi:hypothetical protein
VKRDEWCQRIGSESTDAHDAYSLIRCLLVDTHQRLEARIIPDEIELIAAFVLCGYRRNSRNFVVQEIGTEVVADEWAYVNHFSQSILKRQLQQKARQRLYRDYLVHTPLSLQRLDRLKQLMSTRS